MKSLGLVVSDKKIFENCILKTYFWPRDLHMQPIRTIWTILVGDHSVIIPVKFGIKSNEWFQRIICLSKNVYARRTTTNDGQRPVTIAHPEHKVLRWAKNKRHFKEINFYQLEFPIKWRVHTSLQNIFPSISDQMIHTANNKSKLIPRVCETDKRGKHKNRPNRVSGSQVEFIKRHIESFPATESHYCRKDSKNNILPQISAYQKCTTYI